MTPKVFSESIYFVARRQESKGSTYFSEIYHSHIQAPFERVGLNKLSSQMAPFNRQSKRSYDKFFFVKVFYPHAPLGDFQCIGIAGSSLRDQSGCDETI